MERKRKLIEKVPLEEREHLLKNILPFLPEGRFVYIGTCSFEKAPNVAPKMIIKAEKNILYLADYVIGRTHANLTLNPRASVSFIDEKTLTGYQLNGTADVIEKGEEYERLVEVFQRIKTDFTVERILLNLRTGERIPPQELAIPERMCILKIKVVEIVEIGASGSLKSKCAIG